PAERLSRSRVESERDGIEVSAGVPSEIGALGKVLTQQAVGVLVGASLPGAVWVAEVDRQAGGYPELGVLGHFCSLVPGQRSPQLFGESADRLGDGVPDGFGAMAGQRGTVLDARLIAVALHPR